MAITNVDLTCFLGSYFDNEIPKLNAYTMLVYDFNISRYHRQSLPVPKDISEHSVDAKTQPQLELIALNDFFQRTSNMLAATKPLNLTINLWSPRRATCSVGNGICRMVNGAHVDLQQMWVGNSRMSMDELIASRKNSIFTLRFRQNRQQFEQCIDSGIKAIAHVTKSVNIVYHGARKGTLEGKLCNESQYHALQLAFGAHGITNFRKSEIAKMRELVRLGNL